MGPSVLDRLKIVFIILPAAAVSGIVGAMVTTNKLSGAGIGASVGIAASYFVVGGLDLFQPNKPSIAAQVRNKFISKSLGL